MEGEREWTAARGEEREGTTAARAREESGRRKDARSRVGEGERVERADGLVEQRERLLRVAAPQLLVDLAHLSGGGYGGSRRVASDRIAARRRRRRRRRRRSRRLRAAAAAGRRARRTDDGACGCESVRVGRAAGMGARP